ncbi:hypothetical protein [Longispora fulva]|uniref:Uncharacterized protein n=1 Tax=Longispora fulva TaxID=619741 RepID=A0A8J7GBL3_9ACTN|nr:hypothetical protein [Longispora fulva]MBG6137478.1 hypothetical protein [Longispora fulva]
MSSEHREPTNPFPRYVALALVAAVALGGLVFWMFTVIVHH